MARAAKRTPPTAGRGKTSGGATGASPAASGAIPSEGAHRASPDAGRPPLPRYQSVYEALAAGLVAAAIALLWLRGLTIEIAANAFFAVYLAGIVRRLPRFDQRHLRSHADESDIPGVVILLVALGSVATASTSLLLLLNGAGPPDHVRLALGVLSVVLGWLTVHTMLAFHYAYEYYGTDRQGPEGGDNQPGHAGGLDFPGKQQPDGLAFLYFSFVIAMTAQVSDVTVTSNSMRRLVLLHGILSFFFNTVIIAMAVNIVVSFGH